MNIATPPPIWVQCMPSGFDLYNNSFSLEHSICHDNFQKVTKHEILTILTLFEVTCQCHESSTAEYWHVASICIIIPFLLSEHSICYVNLQKVTRHEILTIRTLLFEVPCQCPAFSTAEYCYTPLKWVYGMPCGFNLYNNSFSLEWTLNLPW